MKNYKQCLFNNEVCFNENVIVAYFVECSVSTDDLCSNRLYISRKVWPDVKSNPINAHGGGIYYDGEYYYFYGEYRVGKSIFSNEWQGSNQKVNMYRSKDLVHWMPVGIVLDLSHLPENYQLERPKIIYNKK